jgi:hypothetical protein
MKKENKKIISFSLFALVTGVVISATQIVAAGDYA